MATNYVSFMFHVSKITNLSQGFLTLYSKILPVLTPSNRLCIKTPFNVRKMKKKQSHSALTYIQQIWCSRIVGKKSRKNLNIN